MKLVFPSLSCSASTFSCVKKGRFLNKIIYFLFFFFFFSAGHYVSFAKNYINGKWYEFNDSWVSEGKLTLSKPLVLLYHIPFHTS